MHPSRWFYAVCFAWGIVTPGVCGVGDVDERTVVDDPSRPPYNKYVYLDAGSKHCTGQYVAPNIILTAAHCVTSGQHYIIPYTKSKYEVRLVGKGTWTKSNKCNSQGTDDWAAFVVEDPKGYSNGYFGLTTLTNNPTKVISAGYGDLRIIKNSEMDRIRKLANRINSQGMKPSDFITELNKKLQADGIDPLWDENQSLKTMQCHIKKSTIANELSSTCDIWGGNSGGAVINMDGDAVYGISHCAIQTSDLAFSAQPYNDASFISTALFESRLNTLIANNPPRYAQQTAPEPEPEPEPESPLRQDGIQISPIGLQELLNRQNEQDQQNIEERMRELQEKLQEQKEELVPQIQIRERLSDRDFLRFLGNIVDYQVTESRLEKLKKQYEEAKANEQSFSNRALTAASVAATGLGTMAAFSAYSEQQADKEAEQDMSNWLATMSCEYGNHQQVKAGNEEISLPGGDLFDYYNEYKQLADRLKTTKTALGLRKGIESEVLYEQAQTGLYQNSNIGKTGGAYTSLARAMTDKEGEDATAWAEQKQDSKTTLWEGVAAAGVGVVGGAVVNYLINGDESASFDGLGFGGNRNKNGTNNNNRNNENDDETAQLLSSASTVSDASGQHGSTVSPSNQVSAVLVCPWNWLFSSTDSTTFDGATRTVKGKSVTAEETMAYDVQHIKDFLNLDKTNAQTQCVTVDARPVDMAQRVLNHYIDALKNFKPNITIEYQLNQRGIYNCAKDATVCDDIFVHVYNRPCGGKLAGKRKAK